MPEKNVVGAGSITWKITSEAAITLGGSRAVLMQLAHPLVAAGVSEHSSYMTDPFGRADRTFVLGQMLTFGSAKTAHEAARTINRLHTHVFGTLPANAGAFSSGTPYRARDPELLLWVHATLIDTILLVYPLLIGPLSLDEQEKYYQESKATARLLGLSPKDMPETLHDLQHYVNNIVYSNRLAATLPARQLAHQLMYPPAPLSLRPLMHFNTFVTCSLLPQPIRDIYGLDWNATQQHTAELLFAGLRAVIPRLPLSMRVLPITRRLMEQGKLR